MCRIVRLRRKTRLAQAGATELAAVPTLSVAVDQAHAGQDGPLVLVSPLIGGALMERRPTPGAQQLPGWTHLWLVDGTNICLILAQI